MDTKLTRETPHTSPVPSFLCTHSMHDMSLHMSINPLPYILEGHLKFLLEGH